MKIFRIAIVLLLSTNMVSAQDRVTTFSSDPSVVDAGLWGYVLPRFRLKTQVTVELADVADVVLSKDSGTRIFTNEAGEEFGVELLERTESAVKFFDWLTSEIGQNTIISYRPDDVQIFFSVAMEQDAVEQLELPGNTDEGKLAARLHCGRCHVVSEENRFGGISSTPSFMALRTFDDWYEKFEIFWTLNPHPVFVQIEGVTPPFNPSIPPSVHPVYLTLDDVDNIGAYLATVEPADLGAPINSR